MFLITELVVKISKKKKRTRPAPKTDLVKPSKPKDVLVKAATTNVPKFNTNSKGIFFGEMSIGEDFEPESDEDDEPWWELNGEENPNIYKVLHYRFLGIQLLDKAPEPEEEEEAPPTKGYGSYLVAGITKKKMVSGREHSAKSFKSNRSFRATLKNSKNQFRSLSITKIKQNFKFQILLGNPVGQVKQYFGCVSSCFLDGYLKYHNTSEHFLRRKAKQFEYNDKSLRDVDKKLADTPSFKPIDRYTQDEMLEYDGKVRQSRTIMDDFTLDVWMFEVFFGKALRYESMATEVAL